MAPSFAQVAEWHLEFLARHQALVKHHPAADVLAEMAWHEGTGVIRDLEMRWEWMAEMVKGVG